MDGTCQCVLSYVQPCDVRSSGFALGLASALGLNGQLHCGTLSGQSPYAWLAGPVGIGPLGILWVGSSYTECLTSV